MQVLTHFNEQHSSTTSPPWARELNHWSVQWMQWFSTLNFQVTQDRHDFKFGFAVTASRIYGGDAASRKYQDAIYSLGNTATIANTLKWRFMESVEVSISIYSYLRGNMETIFGWFSELTLTFCVFRGSHPSQGLTGPLRFSKLTSQCNTGCHENDVNHVWLSWMSSNDIVLHVDQWDVRFD